MVLKLESINIYNFKSFKGIHTISGLDDHFTAIVGPNGSGKSNIIDSILFVLGFKAKKMRQAVLKDLINVGCSEGYVELMFNQFILKRTLKGKLDSDNILKNVTSKYELDGKEYASNEIIEYLKGKGIDLDNNRFLILQGEIETIAMMNPLELLEYIEDCIGSSALKPKIELLDSEVKSKQDEADSLLNNLKFIENDYLFKKGRRDNKLEFLAFRNESLVMKDQIVQMKSEVAQRKEINLRDEKVRIEGLLNDILIKNKDSNRKIKDLEKSISQLDLATKEKQLTKIRNEFSRIERENKNKDFKKERLEKSLEKLNKELEENKQALKNWAGESKKLQKSLSETNGEIKSLESEVKRKKEELLKFNEINQQEAKKVQIEKKLLGFMNTREGHLNEKNEIKLLEERYANLNEKLEKQSAVKNVESEMKLLENEIYQIRKDMEATSQEISRRKRKIEENDYLQQTYRREKDVIDNLKDINGVSGFLKDLGSYDKKYEDAIEASTKALRNVVVDSSATAEKCISVITKKKLNRTTFIILDKLSNPLAVEIPSNCKAEVLYKKVKCDEIFKKAFYFALKDTLCVADLEEAKSLAFGKVRRRVVTIDGKLLEKSGVMSGGKVSKKVKSADELEDIYRNMEKIVISKTKDLSDLREIENQKKMRNSYMKDLSALKSEIENKQSKLHTKDLQILENQILELRNELNNLLNSKIPAKAIEIKNELKMINEKIDILQKMNLEIKMSLGSEPSNNQNSLLKAISKAESELKSFEFELLPDRNHLNMLEEEYNFIYKSYKELEDQLATIRSEMGTNYHEEAQYKTRIEDIQESLKECNKIKQNCESKKNEIHNEFTMTRNLLNQIDPSRIVQLNSHFLNFEEFNDQELKEKSKELIEELNCKESDNFKKLKDLEKCGDQALEEDLEIYRIIFSEFNQSKKIYDEMKTTTDFINSQLSNMKSELELMRNQRLSLFLDGYNAINKNIKEIFSLITFGGNAELDLLDYLNPFSEGIVLNIMPPKKSWKQISNLSGGEKTLSSLGLIFALHKFKPSCLYIMDEIDAALDYKNVSVISQYLAHVKSQFIIISLRNDMFEMAKTLIGVYKYENISKTITVDLNKPQYLNK